jgi:hypothetical protein
MARNDLGVCDEDPGDYRAPLQPHPLDRPVASPASLHAHRRASPLEQQGVAPAAVMTPPYTHRDETGLSAAHPSAPPKSACSPR